MNRYSELITAIFFLLAVAAIVLFFVFPDRTWFYALGGAAVLIRISQYIARLIGPRKRKHEIPDDLK